MQHNEHGWAHSIDRSYNKILIAHPIAIGASANNNNNPNNNTTCPRIGNSDNKIGFWVVDVNLLSTPLSATTSVNATTYIAARM
jgi:hypothetical protein